jgi:hypothetical protein
VTTEIHLFAKTKKDVELQLAQVVAEIEKELLIDGEDLSRIEMLRDAKSAMSLINRKLGALERSGITSLSFEDKSEVMDAISKLQEILTIIKTSKGQFDFSGGLARAAYRRKSQDDPVDWN